MNFARLNHILIPDSKEGRDRFRQTRAGRLFRPLFRLYLALTREGQYITLAWLVFGAAGLEIRTTQIYLLWCITTGLLVASLVTRRFYRMDQVTVDTAAPPRVTVGEDVSITMTLTNASPRDYAHVRVVGPLLPWDGTYVGERRGLRHLPAGGRGRTSIQARFSHRGEHHLDTFHLGQVLPLGVAMGPAVETDGVRFLVVPQMAPIGRLGLPMSARYQPGGVTTASTSGESTEFVGVRPYRSGDRVRDLHARSWARTGYPVVREYRQEYFTRVGVVLDTDREVGDEAHLEAAIELCAGVLGALSGVSRVAAELPSEGALIDLLVVGQTVHRLTLGRQLGTLDQGLDLLAVLEAGPALDPDALGAALSPHLQQLSCVIVILLAWDDRRAQVVQRIRSAGTACKVLLVGEEEAADSDGAAGGSPPRAGDTLVRITPEALRSGTPLVL